MFAVLSLLLMTANAPAGTPTVVLDSVAKSYAHARTQVANLEREGRKVEAVSLLHVGDDEPPELSALAEWFEAQNIKVEYQRVGLKEFNATLDAIDQATDEDDKKAVRLIRYETRANDNLSDAQAMELLAAAKKERLTALKKFFGVPKGITFESYKTMLPTPTEVGVALAKGAVTSSILYYSLASRVAMGDHLNIGAGVAVSALFGFGFDAWQRGNSAFKGQGLSFDPAPRPGLPSFHLNPKFFFFMGFVHSLIMRSAIQAATRCNNADFNLGFHDFLAMAAPVLATSALGALGKTPFEMWIEKARRTHTKAWTIGVMTAWGLSYSALQNAAQFNVQSVFGMHTGDLFRYTLAALGGTGFLAKGIKNRAAIRAGFSRFQDWVLGIHTPRTCETLLTLKTIEAESGVER